MTGFGDDVAYIHSTCNIAHWKRWEEIEIPETFLSSTILNIFKIIKNSDIISLKVFRVYMHGLNIRKCCIMQIIIWQNSKNIRDAMCTTI